MIRRPLIAIIALAVLTSEAVGQGAPATSRSALSPFAVVDGGNAKVYINSVCVTTQGSWLVSMTTGKAGNRHYVALRRSTDRGKTWGERITVLDPPAPFDGEMGQLLAVPTPLGPGKARRIYQFHIVKDTRIGVRFGRLAFTVSEDDGLSWRGPGGPGSVYEVETPAYALAPKQYGWHLMAPGLAMSNGEYLLPMNVSTDPASLKDIRSELVFAVSPNVLTEPDPAKVRFEFHPAPPHGVTAPLRRDPGQSLAQEPQVVELSDHRLFCVMRTGNGVVNTSTSADFGRTWLSPSRPLLRREGGEPIRNPNCPVPLARLSGGRFALLHCDNDGTGNGGRDPFDHMVNRNPVSVAIGREVPGADPPIAFGPSRLLCEIEGYKPEVRWRDLTYGFLLEDGGEYFHFYNAVWRDVLVNRVDPRTLE